MHDIFNIRFWVISLISIEVYFILVNLAITPIEKFHPQFSSIAGTVWIGPKEITGMKVKCKARVNLVILKAAEQGRRSI